MQWNKENPMSMTGKRILVTGASSGIGRAVSVLVSNLGAELVLVGRNEVELKKTMLSLQERKHVMIRMDLKEFSSYDFMFQQIQESGNPLDGMVHCAGIAKVIPVKAISYRNMLETMEINYFAFMELVKFYIKKGIAQGGSIVAVSSVNAHMPQKCMSVYSGSKGALESSITSLAIELSSKKIRINSVIAGGVTTPMAVQTMELVGASNKSASYSFREQLLGAGKPEDVAAVIAFLLSDASAFVTGRHYYADGGSL